MSEDLKIIKKLYGENMMHLCRKIFPTILEQPGLIVELMLKLFEPSRFLYDDIINNNLVEDFRDYVYSHLKQEEKEKIITNKTPKQLLNEAGYILYECKNEKDVQSFKKYYQPDEKLCTFKEERTKNYYVFFAVKKNVEEIKRENFTNPKRDDEYGTSVISIQFTKGKTNTLSIKNRYNHKVYNPDSTFSNNLNNIILGLTESFEREYNLNLKNHKHSINIPGYIKANDGKMYKYNYEVNNIYYCPNNIIIDNFKVIRKYQENEKYLIFECFILDLVNKQIELYDERINDCFKDGITDIEKIYITKTKKTGNKIVAIICKNNKVIIEVDKTNKIIGYENQYIEEINDYFLHNNQSLEYINLPNIKKIGNWFLMRNRKITSIYFPKLEEVGDFFLAYNSIINLLHLPKLRKAGDSFLTSNNALTELYLENLEQIGERAIAYNNTLRIIDMPKLVSIGISFHCEYNYNLKKINLPKLQNNIKNELQKLIEKNKYNETKALLENYKPKSKTKIQGLSHRILGF